MSSAKVHVSMRRNHIGTRTLDCKQRVKVCIHQNSHFLSTSEAFWSPVQSFRTHPESQPLDTLLGRLLTHSFLNGPKERAVEQETNKSTQTLVKSDHTPPPPLPPFPSSKCPPHTPKRKEVTRGQRSCRGYLTHVNPTRLNEQVTNRVCTGWKYREEASLGGQQRRGSTC